MVEWSNPIFYLNIVGLVFSILMWRAVRNHSSELPLKTFAAIMTIGTGLHFIGDLFNYPDDQDHIFIHAVVLVAMAVLGIGALRNQE